MVNVCSNVILNTKVFDLVAKVCLDNYDLICWEHPIRTTVADEAKEVLQQRLETPQHVDQIMQMHAKDCFQDKMGLTETSILIRKHHALVNFSNEWKDCISICRRDQISFDYLVWKHSVRVMKYPDKTRPTDRVSHTGNISKRAVPAVESVGFIMLRHVKCKVTNRYWIESYKCIRKFYPTHKICIIDDNSDETFVSTILLTDTVVIKSEHKGKGELLPYLYYVQTKLFDKAVIIHDSVFIQTYIDFESDNIFLWEFEHDWDKDAKETKLIKKLSNHGPILQLYSQKAKWKGCFGVMSVISHAFLASLNAKYNLKNLISSIENRDDRKRLERAFATLFLYELREQKMQTTTEPVSIFGNIHKPIHLDHLVRLLLMILLVQQVFQLSLWSQ